LTPRNLSPQHLAELHEGSGIEPDVVSQRGYFTASTAAEMERLGFSRKQSRPPALILPLWGLDGELAGYQAKPQGPRIWKGRGIKYEAPSGARMVLDAHPRVRPMLGDPKIPLLITEGIKKSDSAVSRGLCGLGLLGVWGWRGTNERGGKVALADWDQTALNGREVFVAFDSDVMRKPEAQTALRRFKQFLESRGAKVSVIYLPNGPHGEKVGLDDFFVAGGSSEDLFALASPVLRCNEGSKKEVPGLTDLGNARRLVTRHGNDLRYCGEAGWFSWNGHRWAEDTTGEVERRAKETALSVLEEVAREKDDNRRQALLKHATRSQNAHSIRGMIELARTEPIIAVETSSFDVDPWLLNCPNGTLDLRAGKLREHRREDLLTRCLSVAFNSDATAPGWDCFLKRVFAGDAELIDYLQRLFGYCLTGEVNEQVFVFLHGSGANGKSTLIETLLKLLGPYARKADFTTFLAQRRSGTLRDDVADLRGARLVTAVEAGEGRRLDSATVKELSGGDTIRARRLYQNGFTFKPSFKLVLVGNHLPVIGDTSLAMWRRIHLVPFNVTIPEDERDLRLTEKLAAELEGILAWAVQGCREWQRVGLRPPRSVVHATKSYQEEEDTVTQFIEDRCIQRPNGKVRPIDLYRAYRAWAETAGECHPLTKRGLRDNLRSRGLAAPRKGSKGETYWHGLGLRGDSWRGGEGGGGGGNCANFPRGGDIERVCAKLTTSATSTTPRTSPRPACRVCGGVQFWRSRQGDRTCATCHPPAPGAAVQVASKADHRQENQP
jgi:putative DNA primase/helicase